MRQAPFFGWIHDLSAPDPTTIFNLFGLLPFTPPEFLMIGVWPLINGATMFIQQKMSPTPVTDPTQAKIMMALPLVFMVTLAHFPAGLVIYYSWSNLLGIAQMSLIRWRSARRHAAEAAPKAKA
jgi:YidC/Oxa1 family membrane protein insertase